VNTYGVSAVCRVLSLPRSSFYHQPQGRADAAEFERDLLHEAGQHPVEGSRRLTARLRRRARWAHSSRERVRRGMRKLGILRKIRRKRRRTTNSQHGFQRYPNLVKELVIDHPHQAWVCDISAITLADGSEVYLAIILDVFTRKIVGWALRRDLTHELTLSALLRALYKVRPEIHHSDQGVQYADHRYVQYLEQAKVQISIAAVAKAWENGYAARVIGTINNLRIARSLFRDMLYCGLAGNRRPLVTQTGMLPVARSPAHCH
jgi:transposase InsO family protein